MWNILIITKYILLKFNKTFYKNNVLKLSSTLNVKSNKWNKYARFDLANVLTIPSNINYITIQSYLKYYIFKNGIKKDYTLF